MSELSRDEDAGDDENTGDGEVANDERGVNWTERPAQGMGTWISDLEAPLGRVLTNLLHYP
jgi:hypothetical protein